MTVSPESYDRVGIPQIRVRPVVIEPIELPVEAMRDYPSDSRQLVGEPLVRTHTDADVKREELGIAQTRVRTTLGGAGLTREHPPDSFYPSESESNQGSGYFDSNQDSKSAIAFGVVVATMSLLFLLAFCLWRRKNRTRHVLLSPEKVWGNGKANDQDCTVFFSAEVEEEDNEQTLDEQEIPTKEVKYPILERLAQKQ